LILIAIKLSIITNFGSPEREINFAEIEANNERCFEVETDQMTVLVDRRQGYLSKADVIWL
jgi:hypothetical protein